MLELTRGCKSATKMHRRNFLAAAGVAWASGWIARTVRAAGSSTAGLFDFHVHLTQPWHGDEAVTAAGLMRWMDAHEIERAAVLPLVSPESFWYPVATEFVLGETKPHRDRLVPFCSIDPRTLATHLPAKADVVAMLSRYRDAGARGFGEHKPRLAIDDPLSMRLYEACGEVGLPVLFHLDNQANMDEPGLPGLAKALEAFPETTFVGHGKGWWASIAGGVTKADLHVGYPKGPVVIGGAIDALMDKFPNLYGDLSSSGAHAMLRDREFGGQFLARRADRLVFGTDYYDTAITDYPHFTLFDEFNLSADAAEKISRLNAERILAPA